MAISEIVKFDGGLSTKMSSHLIGRNEAVSCRNVDLEKGSLSPISKLSLIDVVYGKHIYPYNDYLISNEDVLDNRFYAEYGGRLYWSNAGYGSEGLLRYNPLKTPNSNVGVPAEPPDTTSLVANIGDVIITEYTDTNSDGLLTFGATYSYAFTIVDNDGIESSPVFHPTQITISNQNKRSVKISISDTDLADWQGVKNVIPTGYSFKLYRIGGNNPTYNLINEDITPISGFSCPDSGFQCIRDNISDINVSRIELNTMENTPPPDDLDMLIENRGTFWGAVGKRVYFSRTGTPEFWGLLDYVTLDQDCTGLGKFGDTTIAFTKSSAYMISGYTRDNIVLQKLPFNQGCTNKDSVVNIDAYLVWTSLNGICVFDGAKIEVLTNKTLAWDEFRRIGNATFDSFGTEKFDSGLGFTMQYAIGYQDRYYGVYSNGLVVLDLANGLKVSTIDVENIVSVQINRDDNFLYVVSENFDAQDISLGSYNVYALLNTSDKMTAIWKTGEITDGTIDVLKHYRRVILDGTPEKVSVYVNGKLRHISVAKSTFFLPPACIGDSIQFEIETVNEIRGLKYEYTQLKG